MLRPLLKKDMNTLIWTLQGFMVLVFMFSGICKSVYSEPKLVSIGQTGVEGLSMPLIRFIGISEIVGSIGLVLPQLLHIYPALTPVSAVCLGAIMIPAAMIHYKRKEYKQVMLNTTFFVICLAIAYYRTN